MSVIEEVLEEIESMTEGDHWDLSLDSVLGILEISREEFYRSQYAKRKRYGMNVDGFDGNNVMRLIDLLEDYGHAAADPFEKAGYYFSQDRLEEWQEFFLSVTASRLLGHEIDRDELENALSACRKPQDGLDFYCETRFNMDEMVRFSSSLFLRKHGIDEHTYAYGVLENYILGMYRRRMLRKEDLFAALHETLIERAIDWKFIKPSEIRRATTLPADIANALELLEMRNDEIPATETLKRHYRALIKRYHPDINPSGLEKTREINSAYTLLISHVSMTHPKS